jgi:CDP-diacylglycerol--glycerol-3-phosphate 3-phosphatidyltransferase
MNLPNLLTLSRIVLTVPALLLLTAGNGTVLYFLSAVVFTVAALTDFFDGRIARKRGLVTDLGKFLDQLSDKILVTSIFLGFLTLSKVSVWFLFVMIFRDTMVSGIRMLASSQGRVIAADFFGKAKTVSQMAFIGILYLNVIWGLFDPLLIVIIELLVAVLTLASGFNYLLKNLQIFKGGS